ncbi:MAG: HEAT repeat domain-containing protein [FCB group bacterium]|jgi:HEAT repeat protein|nr:HEAT repeat domain-containing protein [FCB group bacterium]
MSIQRVFAFAAIAAVLVSAPVWAQAAFDEAAAIGVLTGESTPLQKQETCRALRQKGTVACIPALAAMLPNPELSHMARYALEVMPYPEATQALRDALPKAQGPAKVGVIISIGARRDAEAVGVLTEALSDSDADVARAAAGALGRIATPDSTDALLAFRAEAPEAVHPALAEGLLAAGQYLTREGKGKDAAAIYNVMLGGEWPAYARLGAFRGLTAAEPKKAPKRLLAALAGYDPQFRDLAAQIISETTGATKRYVKAMPNLSPTGQIALLRGLAGRKDPEARPAVAQALSSEDPAVKLAAVSALGTLGNAEDVAALTMLLSADDAETVATADASLAAMTGGDIDPAIAAAYENATPALRAKLLELLANRRAEQAVPLAVAGLKDGDAAIRAASFNVLSMLGRQEQLADVMAALAATTENSERSAAEKALVGMAARGGEPMIDGVLGTLDGSSVENRVVLLRVLASTGNPKALDAVLASLDGADEAVRNEAAWAAIAAATELGKNPGTKELAVNALNTVATKCAGNADIAQRAQEVLGGIK